MQVANLSMVDFDGSSVDIVLLPNVEKAKRTLDITEIWGEEIVYEDVPIMDD